MLAEDNHDNPAFHDTLGGRISLGRETAGLSIEDAARHLGVMTDSWNAWERDRDVPRSSRLTMMAGVLGVSPSWLLTGIGAGPIEPRPEAPQDLMRAFQETSEEIAALNRRMEEIAESLERQHPV